MTKEEILKKLKFGTQIRGLSKNTQDEYYTKAKRFQDYYDKPCNRAGHRQYQKLPVLSLNGEKAFARFNQHV